MATVYACMAPGLEEVECLAAVDVMRRCGIEVILASLGDQKSVTGSHGITVEADEMFDGARCRQADMIFLPGGMPGTTNLMNHEGLRAALLDFHKTEGKRLAAICAAPTVLGANGILAGLHATCYPGREAELTGAIVSDKPVVTDGKVTTGRGLGVALEFGLEIVRLYCGEEKAEDCKAKICLQ
ncbi:MAG: DJ-1/PfpI family protein [Firmicutes bacterium]|nr:DJ-1/PfpI family protein [Bacillota bacterium]MBR4208610.1 DJ-1/PfpI family protein [Lachnospiraceae bacterium]